MPNFPFQWLNHLAGKLSTQKLPYPLLQKFLKFYVQQYQVNMQESLEPLESFTQFHDFFTRKIRPELRTIDSSSPAIISPVDGKISQYGKINQGKLIQAKGKNYSLENLIGKESSPDFQEGNFITFYLSPKDYHRFHAPYASILKKGISFSGNFYPVNSWGVRNVDQLFCKNERLLLFLETDHGPMGMLMVGALVVGKIKLLFEQKMNAGTKVWDPPFAFQKGEELGYFSLGSTVILLFPKGKMQLSNFTTDEPIFLGQKIGAWMDAL